MTGEIDIENINATEAIQHAAFTYTQVEGIMKRKYERLSQRIRSTSKAIKVLQTNHKAHVCRIHERHYQISEIHEDMEYARVWGHEEILIQLTNELQVLKKESERDEQIQQTLDEVINNHQEKRKHFMKERQILSDEIRTFREKQTLLEGMLKECTKRKSSLDDPEEESTSSEVGSRGSEDGYEEDDEQETKKESQEFLEEQEVQSDFQNYTNEEEKPLEDQQMDDPAVEHSLPEQINQVSNISKRCQDRDSISVDNVDKEQTLASTLNTLDDIPSSENKTSIDSLIISNEDENEVSNEVMNTLQIDNQSPAMLGQRSRRSSLEWLLATPEILPLRSRSRSQSHISALWLKPFTFPERSTSSTFLSEIKRRQDQDFILQPLQLP